MDEIDTKSTQNNKEPTRKVGRFWAVFAVVMAIALIAVSVAWAASRAKQNAQAQAMQTKLENTYRQSYYEFTYSLGNLLDNLNKLRVARSPSMQMQLLGQVNAYAVQAATALSGVGEAQQTLRTTKCINQAGDYCLRLQYALALGGALTQADKDNLAGLYVALGEIERSMAALQDEVEEDGFAFVSALGQSNPHLTDALARFETEAASYPALIYDGPFSDALDNKQPTIAAEPAVTQQQALESVSAYLPYAGRITYAGKREGALPVYCFDVATAQGDYRVEITVQGGYLASLNSAAAPDDTVIGEEEAIAFGQDYLASIGLDAMQAVWVSNYNSLYYVNYAYVQSGVVCYSDLAILQIDAQTKRLVGVETIDYLYNHTERALPAAAIDEQAAKDAVAGDIAVESVRLALIPTDGGSEKLTYEVYGKAGDEQYFVYVDAQNATEYKIMRVVDSGQGELVQ